MNDDKDKIGNKNNRDNKNDSMKKSSIKRRNFLGGAVGGIAAISAMTHSSKKAKAAVLNEEPFSANLFPLLIQEEDYEVLIVGSGFGGAVTAARTSKKWPGKVLMVERGKRYGKGGFPRSLKELAKSFWRMPGENVPRLYPLWGEQRGIFDLRSYDHMDTLVAAGYGGGSLIYGVGLIEPVSDLFDETWPDSIKRDKLAPYFDTFRKCLGSNPLPDTGEPERQLNRKALFETIAKNAGKKRVDMDVGIFFGNDPDSPTPAGTIEINRYGVKQTSCTYCGECIVGCNYHAKNSVDLNYLYVAENRFGMQVRTEHQVDKIIPLDTNGSEDYTADGSYGYHVYMVDLVKKKTIRVKSKRVILAAGTYGSTEILFKNKNTHGTLANVSQQLGSHYSGNGDFLTLAFGSKVPTDAGRGPTVMQYIDHTSDQTDKHKQFIAEDMSIPFHLLKSLVDLLSPGYAVRRHLKKLIQANKGNQDILVQVHTGIDKAGGKMSLNWLNGGLHLNWPEHENRELYNEIIRAGHQASDAIDAPVSLAFPTWIWPLRRNVTVHPLGGCALANSSEEGVVSAKPGDMGRVFNYQNLYVADGSIIPSSLGANPSVTIGALAEMIAEEITGLAPTDDLS